MQDEPVSGLGDGDAAPDASGVGTSTAQVRQKELVMVMVEYITLALQQLIRRRHRVTVK